MVSKILVLIGAAALTSCSAGAISFKFYVVISPDETSNFFEAVTTIAKKNGLEIAMSKVAADTGYVLSFIEGRGHGIKLWVQNMPLSGQENPDLCGIHSEPYPDPAQFVVSTEPRFFGSKTEAIKLGEQLFSQIQNTGLEVRRQPAVCGAAAIHERS